jgi:hypothetical protein
MSVGPDSRREGWKGMVRRKEASSLDTLCFYTLLMSFCMNGVK